MVLPGVAAEDEKDIAMPFGVVGGLQIKDDGDQILDVLHGGGLAMEVSDGRGLRGDERVSSSLNVSSRRVEACCSRASAYARSVSRAATAARTRSWVAIADLRRSASS